MSLLITKLTTLGVPFTIPPQGGWVLANNTGDAKAYVSGSFQLKPVKWYDSAAFVTKPLKVFVQS